MQNEILYYTTKERKIFHNFTSQLTVALWPIGPGAPPAAADATGARSAGVEGARAARVEGAGAEGAAVAAVLLQAMMDKKE